MQWYAESSCPTAAAAYYKPSRLFITPEFLTLVVIPMLHLWFQAARVVARCKHSRLRVVLLLYR
jgi:hypothetical protein